MTEPEYVTMIKNAAEAYIRIIRDPHCGDGSAAVRHWQNIKESFSAPTIIALCDAWLAQESAACEAVKVEQEI